MKKRIFALLLAAVMATSVSVAVQADTPEKLDITVTCWNAWVGPDGDEMQARVEQFNEENPYGITVDLTRTSSLHEMLQTGLPAGDAADFIMADTGSMFRYEGYLQPLTTIFEDTRLKEEDFLDAYMERCKGDDGQLYGLPFQIAEMLMFYNKDLFEKNGLDPETPPTTWAEFQEYSEKITDEASKVYGSGLYISYGSQLAAVLQRFGEMAVSYADDGKLKVNLVDNQGLKDGLNYMYTMLNSGNNPFSLDWDSPMQAGQVGLIINGGWLKAGLDKAGINYGIAKVPVVEGDDINKYALSEMNNFYITTCADEKETLAAEKFIEWWYLGSEGIAIDDAPYTRWTVDMGYTSAYKPTIECDYFQNNELAVKVAASNDVEGVETSLYCPADKGRVLSETATKVVEMTDEWIYTDGSEDELNSLLEMYQAELEQVVIDSYGEEMLSK